MKIGLYPAVPTRLVVAAIIAVTAPVLLSGCGPVSNSHASPASASSSHAASNKEPAIELSPGQVTAIKIEPVGSYAFPVEITAVGNVSFDEDPAIVQAESTLVASAAAFDLARKELARVEGLGPTNGISQKEIEQATSDHQTTKAALKAARDALRALGKTDAEIDEMVAAGKIQPPAPRGRWAVASVPESDSPRLKVGQAVQAEATAFPGRSFAGKISTIYATIDPATHRMTIRCEIEDQDSQLRPGMLADLTIRVQDPVSATAVPAAAVVRESDGTTTSWVTTDRHRFVQRTIKVGLRHNGRVQVLEGLERGEMVVTQGAVFLSNQLNAPPTD